MGAWDDYRDCCRVTAAHDRDAVFCPDCRHRLFRCPAPDCGGLVTPLGHCPACIDLHLSLEKGAVLKARLGDCLSVPFVLRNHASVRSLSVKSVLRDATNLPQEAVAITWEQLDPGRARAFAVATGPFAHGGVNNLRLTLVVSASFGDVEETYAFSGDVAIDVEGHDPTQVVQTFNLTGVDLGRGMVVANPNVSATDHRGRHADGLAARSDIALERAERYEIEHGYRGYEQLGTRIPRDVEFQYVGFPSSDRPPDGPLPQRPVIRCGRNARASDGRQNAQPNDLCLRIYDAASGNVDRDASASISRHVCDFVLQNQRLYVRSTSDAGFARNGDHLAAGTARIVGHGDAFTVAAGRRQLVFGTTLRISSGLVTQVRFEKRP
jgi:hypothetical protein